MIFVTSKYCDAVDSEIAGLSLLRRLILHAELSHEADNIVSVYVQAFKKAVDDKFKEYLSIRGTAKNTGECMTDLFDQIRQHRVNMDGDVCTVMVTTLILEVGHVPSTVSLSQSQSLAL